MSEFQHKPAKKLTYRERVLAGKVQQWGRAEAGPRVKIRQVSHKQRRRLKTYNEMKEVLWPLPAYQECWRCPARGEMEMHHPFGRTGENLFIFEPVCGECHREIHANPNQATIDGWLQPEYRKKLT